MHYFFTKARVALAECFILTVVIVPGFVLYYLTKHRLTQSRPIKKIHR